MALGADHSNRNRRIRGTREGKVIVAAVQVDPDFLRFARLKPPPEVRRRASWAGQEKNLHRTAGLIVDLSELGSISAVDVYHPGQSVVIRSRDLWQAVAPDSVSNTIGFRCAATP